MKHAKKEKRHGAKARKKEKINQENAFRWLLHSTNLGVQNKN